MAPAERREEAEGEAKCGGGEGQNSVTACHAARGPLVKQRPLDTAEAGGEDVTAGDAAGGGGEGEVFTTAFEAAGGGGVGKATAGGGAVGGEEEAGEAGVEAVAKAILMNLSTANLIEFSTS